MNKYSLLLIEDNAHIQQANKDMLELAGYAVDIAMNLKEARLYLASKKPDAIVLDVMLPDGSGLDFLLELRENFATMPILILSALGAANDTVLGLSYGADDYLAKPYDYQVLAARIEALIRRTMHVPEAIVRGLLTLNIVSGQAFLRGKDLMLTNKEFYCLLRLVQQEGNILSPEYLYQAVWHLPLNNDSQAIRTAITRLRNKISGSGFMIKTFRGKGYSFMEE